MSEGDFPDALILAALKRAELHDRHDEPGASYHSVVDHLGLKMGPSTGHKLRPRFRAMLAAGLLEQRKRHGAVVYEATARGRRVLEASGDVVLPESPQHRHWREARAQATGRIQGFRGDLNVLLGEAASFANNATDSEAWFTIGERLVRACKRLGSATYCLREWGEPSDDAADIDQSPRRGRRTTGGWDSPYA